MLVAHHHGTEASTFMLFPLNYFFNYFLPVGFELGFCFEGFLDFFFPPLLSFLLYTCHSEEGAASMPGHETLVLSAENSFSGVNAGVCPCRAGAWFCKTSALTHGNQSNYTSKIKQPETTSAVPDQDEMETIKH